MKYSLLGDSDLQVSEIGFGCMSLEGERADNIRLLQHALDKGINFFDTADLYQEGESEKTVGESFKDRRDKAIIATKVGNQLRSDGTGWDWNPSKSYILEAVEKSLKRLQTDYIDLYQLHGGTIDDPIDETIEAFEQLKEQGKIRYYGISSIRPNVIREWVRRSAMVSVMMQYSLLDRRPEAECLELLKEHHTGVLARGCLARGMLVDKEPAAYLDYSQQEVEQMQAAVRSVGAKVRNPAEVAIKFVLQHPAVAASVVGIRTFEQLEEVLEIGKKLPINEEESRLLKNTIRPLHYHQHR
jgi:aryl-alcohol dehydrogenase-like predicted oxidoreductase